MAVNQRVHEGVVLLLAGGADVNAVDQYGDTPLHVAAWNLDPEGCLQLLEAGADTTVRGFHGRTPLDVAIRGNIQSSSEDWEETQEVLKRAVGNSSITS
jgi:ankyrin repeat protein